MPARTAPRKPALSSPAAHTTTGTIADFIIRQVEAGSDIFSAAGSQGIPAGELRSWLQEGQTQWTRAVTTTANWARDFTPEQQDLALFYEAATRAVDTNRSRGSILLEQHVRGGLSRTTVRTKTDKDGNLLERVEVTETLLPSLDALKFKLEHVHPDVYGARATLNLNVTDLSDTEDVGRALQEAMTQVIAQLGEATIIDTTATQDPAP